MLRIHVLGEMLVEGSGGPVDLTGSWRARSLLAWLALHPGVHLRGDVAARFWPDILDSSARASLRNGLWALRRALGAEAGEILIATRTHVGLQTPPSVWVDAAAFEALVAAGSLEDALSLCRGELLAGVDEEWVYAYRDAHRDRLSELLERMASKAEAAADPTTEIALARRRVALDPLAEDAQRVLIARLARVGDRVGALSAYARLRERLRRELGISPSQETRSLVARIREAPIEPPSSGAPGAAGRPSAADNGDWAPGAPFPLPPRLRRPASAPFVGRAGEMAALRRLWSKARTTGEARLVLVFGEAGMGKSRLLRELALEVRDQGAVVLHGSANEDLLVPHEHFVEALAHYFSVAGASELRRRVGYLAADLAPIAPSLARDGESAGRGEGRDESRRYRLFESVASFLERLALDAPVLLLLDDLQWADQSTAALLRHTLESRAEMRLLVVATQRPADVDPAGALAEALQRLSQQDFVERMELPGLRDADIAVLSGSLTGQVLPADLVRAIGAETGGNPFFTQEIVRHLGDSGDAGGLLWLARADVPEGIRQVLDLRLMRLGQACVRLLTVAAVIGTDFEFAALEGASDLQGEDLATALDEALAADLIIETDPRGQESFSFSHALLRRTLLGRLTRAHRRRIHARVAAALHDTRGDAALLEIAHHLCEALPAVDRERAFDYAARAADQAISALAYAEAVDLFSRALSLLPEGDARRRVLALKRALAYQALFHTVMDAPR